MPSKRIILLIVVCISFVGFLIALKSYRGREAPSVQSAKSDPTPIIEEKDVDSDGLKDWEEVLLGSNPNNPDSDGNGIVDGKEKNFLKGDGLALFQTTEAPAATSPDQTKTDQVTQKFLIDYLSLKQGGAINQSSKEALVYNFSQQVFSQSQATSTYTQKDLVVVPENKTSLLAYANAVYSLFSEYGADLRVALNDPAITDIASPQYTQKLLLASKVYKIVAKLLVSMPVPVNVSPTHLALANTYVRISKDLAGISAAETDYVLMLGSVKNYNNDDAREKILLKTLENYLSARGIIFSEKDDRYILSPI